MATFYCGQDQLSIRPDPTPARNYTDGYILGTNSDIPCDVSTVNHIIWSTSGDVVTENHFGSDTSDDMDTISHLSLDTTNDMDTANFGLQNSNNIRTESHKSLDISSNVLSENPVDSDVKKTSATITESDGENLEKRKSSTAFIIDFGSDSSSNLSISDRLSWYLPKHVAQRVELRASNVKVRSDRDKTVDKEGSPPRSEKSVPAVQDRPRPARHDSNSKPELRRSLPNNNVPRIEASPSQHSTNAKKKQVKDTVHEGKCSWSSALRNLPSSNDSSSFRTPCRNVSCPVNQSSAVSVSSASNSHFISSCLTDLNISGLEPKNLSPLTGAKYSHRGKVRSNQSYTILSSGKPDEASDSVSESGTYEVDEEQREDIVKARRTIGRVFGVRSSPKRSAVKPRRPVQFPRSSARKQSPAKKVTTGSAVNRPGGRTGISSTVHPNKFKIRCQERGKILPFLRSKVGNSVENLDRSASNNQSTNSSKAATRSLPTEKGNNASAGKDSRPNDHNSPIIQPLKSRLCSFGVSASDHVVNSSSGKVAVSCPVMQRPAPVNLRMNRTFELRCARLETNTAVARKAEKTSLLLPKIRHRFRKLPTDGTQETSSYTSICSRESGNSTSIYGLRDIACTLRELKQNVQQSSCSLLQEEVLSPADSSTSITVDGSYTSLDRTLAKKPHVRKTSSMLAYPRPPRKDKTEALAACSPKKGPTFQDKFALNLPEVRAWHERHQNDQSKRTPLKVLPWHRNAGQIKTMPAKKEQGKVHKTLLGNNSSTTMATTSHGSISAFPAKNGNELNALKMLLKMSEEVTAQLRRINESHVRGVSLELGQQQTVTDAMISAFKNLLQTEKDVQDIGKALKTEQR